jgi:hypothetical protein
MAVMVTSEGPVQLSKHVCVGCCYELSYAPVDLVSHRTDGEGDPHSLRGQTR